MAEQHLRTLEAYGFEWDGTILLQSTHLDLHAEALRRLRRLGRSYECTCSRAEVAALSAAAAGAAGEEELHYPGLCRSGPRHPRRPGAVRFRVEDRELAFDDRWQGPSLDNVARSVGDFIIRRRDAIPAYQLAVVVDDAAQGVTDIVRGCDLLSSTPRQILLQEALGLARPSYAHLPLIVAADGAKLSKSRHAIGLDSANAGATLVSLLNLLGQAPPRELAGAAPAEVWTWAIAHWNAGTLHGRRSIRAPD
jgi:glutamyl-Q tRNA(Asp) synthetase